MYLKTCRCGKTQKNFKMDIGPFFINKCCKEAGYDVHGKKAEDAVEQVKEANEMAADQIIEDMNPADINKDGKVDEQDLSAVHKAYAEEKTTKKKTRRKRTKKN